MNNKKLGTEFEQEFCSLLASRGYWVHFISPAPNGAQPFDIIAVKSGCAYAFDCKTSVSNRFPISRLEENQIMAFERWLKCGNNEPMVAIKYNNELHIVKYAQLRKERIVSLGKESLFAYL